MERNQAMQYNKESSFYKNLLHVIILQKPLSIIVTCAVSNYCRFQTNYNQSSVTHNFK